jgi:HlyD family secretion protein
MPMEKSTGPLRESMQGGSGRTPPRTLRVALGIALGAFLAGLALARVDFFGAEDPLDGIPVARVQRGDIEITISESGELRSEHQATVSAYADQRIVWLAPEGSVVSKGDPLVKFESSKHEVGKANAESEVAVAVANLRRAENELAAQRTNEQKARLDYEALPALEKKGFVTRTELEIARLAYQKVKAQTRSVEAALDVAHAHVERARQEVARHDRKLERGTVRAPRDGVVVYAIHGEATSPRKVSIGSTTFQGMEIMYLPDPSSMRVETQIGEQDLARVKLGSRVEIRLEAYPDLTFPGKVIRIGDLARPKVSRITGTALGIRVFDVSIEVDADDPRLKPGLSANVEILISENPDVLYVPIAAIFLDELDEAVVYRRRGDLVEAQRVELGGSTDRIAIVRSGLEEADEVLLAAPPGS